MMQIKAQKLKTIFILDIKKCFPYILILDVIY